MKELQDSQDNFWISYADLMAGLLFVFILVIGAVIVKHNFLTSELASTKERIYKLTTIKTSIISKLHKKLGNKIAIDPKSGALSIEGNILFKQGEYTLREDAKQELTNILSEYIKVLMDDPEIKSNLDKIIIEGHTNSDGGYIYNLELSQKRALEVMKFLLTLNINTQAELKKYVTANGRSETDLIMENGKENKFASRRIEIKFRLKNDEAVSEISNMLSKNAITN